MNTHVLSAYGCLFLNSAVLCTLSAVLWAWNDYPHFIEEEIQDPECSKLHSWWHS